MSTKLQNLSTTQPITHQYRNSHNNSMQAAIDVEFSRWFIHRVSKNDRYLIFCRLMKAEPIFIIFGMQYLSNLSFWKHF